MSSVDPSLSNRDLTPTTPAQRTWGFYNYTALWFSMCMEITTYRLASGLIAKGMDWKQAIGTVLLGNLIVLVPMLLNAHAGAKYGIPFPVFLRASFGVRGANLAALLRAVVACGWFGIQSWIGGSAIRRDADRDLAGRGRKRRHFVGMLPGLLAAEHGGGVAGRRVDPAAAGVWRAVHVCDGGGAAGLGADEGGQLWRHAIDAEHVPLNGASFSAVFFPSLTAMVGYWATLALNIPDFTRYSKSQSAQSWGQAFGLPVAMVLYTFLGIAVTSASAVLFGKPIWDPVQLIGMFHQPVVAFIALIAVLVATLNVNIGANVVSPSNDFSNLYPRLISFQDRRIDYRISRPGDVPVEAAGHSGCVHLRMAGGLLRAAGAGGRDHGVRLLLHPRDGAGCELALSSRGRVPLHQGSQSAGGDRVGSWGGNRAGRRFVKPLHFLYDYAWFVGFFTAGASYVAMMKLAAPAGVAESAEEVA